MVQMIYSNSGSVAENASVKIDKGNISTPRHLENSTSRYRDASLICPMELDIESATGTGCIVKSHLYGLSRKRFYRLCIVIILLLVSNRPTSADSFHLESPYNKGTLRLEIDNDTVWDNDSNFSNGWSIQYHTKCYPGWNETKMPGWVKWVGKQLFGPGDQNTVVRNSQGIGQNMITPGDLTAETPLQDDLPYAGTLTYTLNWQRFNRQAGRNLQLSLGLLGEYSLAEEFQRFVHKDLGRGDDPRGWHSQRASEPIVNIGYEHLWRLAHLGRFNNGWAGQLTLAPSASLGNLFTAAELGVALRVGWNILEGFNAYPAPPGRGFFQAAYLPKPSSASAHSFEFVLGARACGLIYSVIYDGSIITDDHRSVDRNNFVFAAGAGLFYHYYKKFSIRLTIQRTTDMLNADAIPEPSSGKPKTNADLSYGALTMDFYF